MIVWVVEANQDMVRASNLVSSTWPDTGSTTTTLSTVAVDRKYDYGARTKASSMAKPYDAFFDTYTLLTPLAVVDGFFTTVVLFNPVIA